ncbi:mandelate racemase/muconate lactonizing enzyme family protein [Candidatus Bathyarchaeota archaeon]|nr:MAG: mandelate racemase/muconate lactonizing enzyme family protein [Candidatus Bathyarchaeota archaeon]
MKITKIKTFIVHPGVGKNWLFVKVETDEGIHGWGEAYTQADRDTAIEAHIHKMTRYLLGWNPFEIKRFTHMAYEDWASKRGGIDFFCAVSGIEQALWDIVGKKLNQPVYNLLGGPCRDRIRVYANGWTARAKTPQELGDRARDVVKKGFTALKFDPFSGPWRLYIRREEELQAIENLKAVREAVGPDVDILVEVHRRLAPMHAIRVAHAMEAYRPFWYEEPVPRENLEALAEVRRGINIPVVTGECIYTKAGFRKVFEKRAADIINPDVCNTGGILELKEIAAMAEPHYVAVSPHNYNSTTIGLAASVQAAAVMTNFLILEYFVSFEAMGFEVAVEPLRVEKGFIRLPKTPGLGVELKEKALAQYQYKEFPKRPMERYLA